MINKYNNAINKLQANYRNGTYDEILQDYNGNIKEAYECLKAVLTNMLDKLEGTELDFYKTILLEL